LFIFILKNTHSSIELVKFQEKIKFITKIKAGVMLSIQYALFFTKNQAGSVCL